MLIGKVLHNHYKIIEKLEKGQFGDTYLAQDWDLPDNPPCVVQHFKLKTYEAEVLCFAKNLFDTQTKLLYRLGNEHPQIPRLFARFEENGEFYLVQEYIEGEDLSQTLTLGKRLSENEVIQLLEEILEVLKFVHDNKVIHQDLSLNKIKRRRKDGKIVLIDFGAIKEIATLGVNYQGQTEVKYPIGTPGYMPRETNKG